MNWCHGDAPMRGENTGTKMSGANSLGRAEMKKNGGGDDELRRASATAWGHDSTRKERANAEGR